MRQGKGFRYLDASGKALPPGEVERIKALVIPPAWRDVWICPDPKGHIQAVGTDAVTPGARQEEHPLLRLVGRGQPRADVAHPGRDAHGTTAVRHHEPGRLHHAILARGVVASSRVEAVAKAAAPRKTEPGDACASDQPNTAPATAGTTVSATAAMPVSAP